MKITSVDISFVKAAVLCLAVLAATDSIASEKSINPEQHIGLYEIINSECNVPNNEFNPCGSTLFFEIVKGQFVGVEKNELAYVFWSGDPKEGSELSYTSHLIRKHKSAKTADDIFWLNNDSESQEYLVFSGGRLVGYHVVYHGSNKTKRRSIHYRLKPVRRGNLPHVQMNYPGKD
ncbi:MAG: hypothetical protein OEZ39_00845 [Gammaproteobacteria bacterium]|nr:hypothetical protein [Gammaproteobacteria bacterium]MDH5650397.1 hypothetical protein [Gammaproteobacteria bacterium]